MDTAPTRANKRSLQELRNAKTQLREKRARVDAGIVAVKREIAAHPDRKADKAAKRRAHLRVQLPEYFYARLVTHPENAVLGALCALHIRYEEEGVERGDRTYSDELSIRMKFDSGKKVSYYWEEDGYEDPKVKVKPMSQDDGKLPDAELWAKLMRDHDGKASSAVIALVCYVVREWDCRDNECIAKAWAKKAEYKTTFGV